MVWLGMAAVALAGALPATGAGQEEGGTRRDRDAPRQWAAPVRCEQALARDGREGWKRLCLPGDPLRLGASFAWGLERRGEGKGAKRPDGPDRRNDDRPDDDRPRDGRDGPADRDGPSDRADDDFGDRAGDDFGDRAGDDFGDRGNAGGPACATGVEAGCAATVTPEPVTLVLLGSGLAGIAGASYRRRRRETPPGDE